MQPDDSMKSSATDADSSSPASATDTKSIGPECFASADEGVISWKGRNYYPGSAYGPLPPKWSETAERERLQPIRSLDEPPLLDTTKRITQADLDAAMDRVAAKHCERHVMKTSILGGEPLTVSRCMACGTVDWEDLRRQADAYARRYAARLLEETYGYIEYPDGSRGMKQYDNGEPVMINIRQIHSLFTKEPGQDGYALAGPIPLTSFCTDPGCAVDHSVTERPK